METQQREAEGAAYDIKDHLKSSGTSSIEPQEPENNDDEQLGCKDSLKEEIFVSVHRPTRSTAKQSISTPSTPPKRCETLLASLIDLTNRIQEITTVLSTDKSTHGSSLLASLLCERAAVCLEYGGYDASVHLPTDGNFAVQQALDDALGVIAIYSQSCSEIAHTIASQAYLSAAQASRALGKRTDAMEFVIHGIQLNPHHTQLERLRKQLEVDLEYDQISSPDLLCYRDQSSVSCSLQQELESQYQRLQTLHRSPFLYHMEHLFHANVFHQCACPTDVSTLSKAMEETLQFLLFLLKDPIAAPSLGLGDLKMITKTLETSPTSIIEHGISRRWMIKILVPAVIQSLSSDSDAHIVSLASSSRASLLYDLFIVFTRILLAIGAIQWCTQMPHALSYLKMAYEIAQQLDRDNSSSNSLVRLEMHCADLYGIALMDIVGGMDAYQEAMELHQSSLDLALDCHDRMWTLRSQYLIGRALYLNHDQDGAHQQWKQFLTSSQLSHDCSMEALAWYQLGMISIRHETDVFMTCFLRALRLCNETFQCHQQWRNQAIQDAITFYSSLVQRPTRRGAIITRTVFPRHRHKWGSQEEIKILPSRREGLVWTTSDPLIKNTSTNVDRPLSTLRVSLLKWLIGHGMTSESNPTKPICTPPLQ